MELFLRVPAAVFASLKELPTAKAKMITNDNSVTVIILIVKAMIIKAPGLSDRLLGDGSADPPGDASNPPVPWPSAASVVRAASPGRLKWRFERLHTSAHDVEPNSLIAMASNLIAMASNLKLCK